MIWQVGAGNCEVGGRRGGFDVCVYIMFYIVEVQKLRAYCIFL